MLDLGNLKACPPVILLCPSPVCIPGEMRVQLLNQTLLDLGLYDDGPYEVADQKQLNAQLIPVPYHSYLGRICPPCWLSPVHRRGREGRWGDTPGLRLHLSMLDKWTNSSGGLSLPCWIFLFEINVGGRMWENVKRGILWPVIPIIPLFTKSGKTSLHLLNEQMEKRKRTQSEPEMSSPHHCTQWFSRKQHQSTKTNQSQPVSPAHPSPFFSFCPLLYPPHHFTTPSLPTTLCPSPPISGHLGLLFMASPIEDALLYKTLEPSSRPTPFEDVAHNSYLGL